jgi:ribonuclease P protein component
MNPVVDSDLQAAGVPKVSSLTAREDFGLLLAGRPKVRTAGWSLYLRRSPPQSSDKLIETELSTGQSAMTTSLVDDLVGKALPGVQVGVVLSRRMVRRAVSRNLVRRTWRELVREHALRWSGCQLLLRRHAPWPRAEFPSASSDALKTWVQAELRALLDRAAGVRGGAP